MKNKKTGKPMSASSSGPLKQGLKKGDGAPKDSVEPKPRKMPTMRGNK